MTDVAPDAQAAREAAEQFRETYDRIETQVSRMMVGQKDVVEGVLTALLAGGHVLLEGVPGLGKTMLVRALGQAVDLAFSRIQFTPDLMPADIQGTHVLVDTEGGGHELEFRQGPLVANLVLADEINRATPKTQSALLEAMQEHQISVGRRTIRLEEPYCVMATQNPVEQEGTYPLPEAQLDRFMFMIHVGYPSADEELKIIQETTSAKETKLGQVLDGDDILALQDLVRKVPVADHVVNYALEFSRRTRVTQEESPDFVKQWVAWGSGPRASQYLILGAKARAILNGRTFVSGEDIRAVAHPVLRHRIICNFSAEAEGITSDTIVDKLIESIPRADADAGTTA
ncbi:MAG: MoxR family ATPase [Planctomycetota bacterium]|nr:MoxR family ATPase [Planctomycetota bacterium]